LALGEAVAVIGRSTSFLDTHALAGDLPIPFKDFGDTSHPQTEHRSDDLEARSASFTRFSCWR